MSLTIFARAGIRRVAKAASRHPGPHLRSMRWGDGRGSTNPTDTTRKETQMSTADERQFFKLVAEAILALASNETGVARQLAEEVQALASRWES